MPESVASKARALTIAGAITMLVALAACQPAVKVTITVSASATKVYRGAPLVLSGTVGPSRPNATVVAERLAGGSWIQVGTGKTSSSSRYSISLRPGSVTTYSLRVRRPAQGQDREGVSPTVKVVVSALPTVSASVGGARTVAGCTTATCRSLVVNISGGFAPFHVSCVSSGAGKFYSYTTSTRSTQACVFGNPGESVWAIVDGSSSNHLVWPGPSPSVIVARGAATSVAGCTVAACSYLTVSVANLTAPFSVSCYSGLDSGAYYTYSTNNATSNVCVFGYPGQSTWAVVNGVSSNHVTW
jgi:hypothetical protein